MSGRGSWFGDAIAGGAAGAVATWVMDLATTGFLQQQPDAASEQEREVQPNDRSSVGNIVARLDDALGLDLDEGGRATASTVVHYGLGAVPGAIYGILRGRLPGARLGNGLGYGLVLWAVNDELLNSALGLSAAPAEYPADTHWRGLVGHVVLGLVTDSMLSLLRRS